MSQPSRPSIVATSGARCCWSGSARIGAWPSRWRPVGLEEFPATAVEHAGGRDVVQYRGEILPLVHLADALGVPAAYDLKPGEPLNVVVHAHGDRSVGLVVGRILDIVEERVNLERRTDRPGLVGSAVIQQHVTDVLDIAEVVRSVDPAGFSTDFPTSLLGV